MSEKCYEAAEKFRSDGNLHFRSGEFCKALIAYNRSLCHAASGIQLALAYANRSAVYMTTKLYEICLENTELARVNGYPTNKMQKLRSRESKCRKLLETFQGNPQNDPWNFFKLSHPANERIPFIVNCLELREDETFGRHIVTTSFLKAGDVIAIEEAFHKFINREARHSRCANCLKSNKLSLIPCEWCTNSEFVVFEFLY